MEELKKLKSTRPSLIRAALHKLPQTLDGTYERMLSDIDGDIRKDAVNLLRWLAYARSPPTLAELVHVAVVDLDEGVVNFDDEGSLEDTLDILAGLITVNGGSKDIPDGDEGGKSDRGDETIGRQESDLLYQIDRDTTIRLAHFSVKEYLESERITGSLAAAFAFDPGREHRLLKQTCTTYLLHYLGGCGTARTKKDLVRLPLLRYAAESWYYHSSVQRPGAVDSEVNILRDEQTMKGWLKIHQPDRSWQEAFDGAADMGSGIYYASYMGLSALIDPLVRAGIDANAQGGRFGNALQAASYEGHAAVVGMLLAKGADVNARGGFYGNALYAASYAGREAVVETLLANGADVNAQGGIYGNILYAAAYAGHKKVVEILLAKGADVDAQAGFYGKALYAASERGHEAVVDVLLAKGADVNARGGIYGNALAAASREGHERVVEKLMRAGARE